MNKSELAESLAKELKLPARDTLSIVNTILDIMTEALVNGEHVEIRGFGSLTVRDYDAYAGRNPRTGESIEVEPKKLPFFIPGKALREAVDAAKK